MRQTDKISYDFDPDGQRLNINVNGKLRGGFVGASAEREFLRLMDTGVDITITNMNKDAYKKILIRNFHAALAAQGIMEHKESILSGCGVEHTTDLTIDQLKELVATYSTGERKKRADDPAEIRQLRSDLLTIMQKMGIYAKNEDWGPVNDFCVRHTGKMLYQMGMDELVKARKQFNAILSWSADKQIEINRQKLLN